MATVNVSFLYLCLKQIRTDNLEFDTLNNRKTSTKYATLIHPSIFSCLYICRAYKE